jgi:hypothetical protein
MKEKITLLKFCVLIWSFAIFSKNTYGSTPGQVIYDMKIADVAKAFTSFSENKNNSTVIVTSAGLTVTGTNQHPPAVQIDNIALPVGSKKWLIVRMSSNAGPFGGFYFKTTTGATQYFTFPIISDGQLRTYNIYLGDETIPRKEVRSKFNGTISLFAIIPTYERNTVGHIESVEFSETNQSNGFFIPEYTGAFISLYRVGRPDPVAVRVRNGGGIALTGISVKFESEDNIKINSAFRDIPDSIGPDKSATFYADVLPLSPGRKNFKIIVTASNGESVTIPGNLNIEPALINIEGSDKFVTGKIPDPNPVKIPDYDIGMYYFTGWSHLNHWPSIVPYAERRPELGYYDESSGDAANWTIKWAVENGVEFINVLLYWRNHLPWNEKFLNLGLMKASFLPYIKFYVTWSNDVGNQTKDDFVNFYKYVIDNYFVSPSYKRSENGRPMVGILSVSKMATALGGITEIESLIKQVNSYAVSKGYTGVFWVAGGGGSNRYKANGFEGFTYYNNPAGGSSGYPCSNASVLIPSQPQLWNGLYLADCPTCVTLVPTTTGFNHRPWFGKMITYGLRYNFTPELFEQNLRDAKSFIDTRGQKTILIECWNEWGEGSALGPTGLYGFSLLDVIPKVFAPDELKRPHIVPRDVNVYPPEIKGLWDIKGLKRPDFGNELY